MKNRIIYKLEFIKIVCYSLIILEKFIQNWNYDVHFNVLYIQVNTNSFPFFPSSSSP